jgi:hypothetical protein
MEVFKSVTQSATAKTASENIQIDQAAMLKFAAQIFAGDGDQMIKNGHVLGQAIMTGMIMEGNRYKQASEQARQEKVASLATGNDELEKFAQANPDLFQQAVKLGYDERTREIKNTIDYVEAANYAQQHIHKMAYDHYAVAYDAMNEAINSGLVTLK